MMSDVREKLQHREARRIVEFYLRAKSRKVYSNSFFSYPASFVEEHKLKKFPGHSYDIMTNMEIIEIDDMDKHLHKTQLINDQIAEDYAKKHLKEYRFYRLLKEEIVNRRGLLQEGTLHYLKVNLF